MLELMKNVDQRLPVVLKSTSGSPMIGVSYSSVYVSIIKADGAQIDLPVTPARWMEATGTAYFQQGYYNYIMSGSSLDQTGTFQYCVYTSGSVPYFGVVKITDGDTGAIFNRIGTPVSGTIVADVSGTSLNIDRLSRVLGKPVTTVAQDVKETARLVKQGIDSLKK